MYLKILWHVISVKSVRQRRIAVENSGAEVFTFFVLCTCCLAVGMNSFFFF